LLFIVRESARVFHQVNIQSPAYNIIALVLRVVLVLALAFAGWTIYRGLPGGDAPTANNPNRADATELQLVLMPSADEADAPLNINVQIYPIDVAAVRREFFSERRAGMRFDDFLARRMNGRTPIETRLDQRGQATVRVPPGNWWIHATLTGSLNVEWRLPVNVHGRQQTVELKSENAYARTKSF
jgi:hypothetical protein